MQLDFSSVCQILDKLAAYLNNGVKDVFHRSGWEDDVKGSYRSFLDDCSEAEHIIRISISDLYGVQSSASNIQPADKVSDTLKNIKSQADAIKVE